MCIDSLFICALEIKSGESWKGASKPSFPPHRVLFSPPTQFIYRLWCSSLLLRAQEACALLRRQNVCSQGQHTEVRSLSDDAIATVPDEMVSNEQHTSYSKIFPKSFLFSKLASHLYQLGSARMGVVVCSKTTPIRRGKEVSSRSGSSSCSKGFSIQDDQHERGWSA